MEAALQRVTPADLEIRGDGRTVYGLFVPFDQEATVSDGRKVYREVFRYGSLTKTIQERGDRIKLLVNHDRQRLPIGKPVTLREDKAGGVGEFHLSNTRDADEAIELIRDGVLDSFSVGFVPVKSRNAGEVVERTEVRLNEVSVVAFPAYQGAAIAGVRHENPDLLARVEELERMLALAHDLSTHSEDEATSDDEPQTRTDEPDDVHSEAINHDALRMRLKAYCQGITIA